MTDVAARNKTLLLKLAGVVVLMFLFAVFVMPPLYDAFCELTGLNGKTSGKAASGPAAAVEQGRSLNVEFLTSTDKELPWLFRYETASVKVHPGEIVKVGFYVKNNADQAVTGRAVPSISPAEATQYFKKTECFCFREQKLEAGSEKEMPVVFYVDPAIPRHLTTITLSYRFYRMKDEVAVASR